MTTRPQSTFHPLPAPIEIETKKRPQSLATRQPLSVLSISPQAQTFQERHRTQFAHLHQHSDDSLREKRLEAEKAELENARKVGREKRESVRLGQVSVRGGKGGRRPLSLVVRHAGREEERRSSMPLNLAPSIMRRNSKNTSIIRGTPRGSELNVVVETPNLDATDSPDTSISQSSYSWASQFSGETDELRTAAHYIPQLDEDAEEELADEQEDDTHVTPKDGTTRRRKKIVALAHTVRQLEGVGSREAEDPALYDTLVKAWNERPLNQAPTTGDDQSPLPFTPHLPNSRHSEGSSINPDSSFAYSDETGRRSNSLRYSYASTLHDLAIDGGIEQANRIFLAKPWLRGSIVNAGNQEEFLSGPPTDSASESYPRGDNRHLSLGDAPPPFLASPILISDPAIAEQGSQQTLRKAKRVIDFTVTPEPSPPISEAHVPAEEKEQEDAATGWGLGFMGGWFGSSDPSAPTPPIGTEVETEEGEETMTRSTTVAQFDDALNDDSLDDAEGESDPEYEDAEVGQVFHEEGDGVVTNITTSPPVPSSLLQVEEREEARPESAIIPQLLIEEDSRIQLDQDQDEQAKLDRNQDQEQDQTNNLTNVNDDTDSPSLNHYQLPTSSIPSITSYPLPTPVQRPRMAVITTNTNEEIQSARGSCHSSDSCSSPSLNMKKRGSRPSLTPILTGLAEMEDPMSLGPVIEEPRTDDLEKQGEELVKNLRDERFSNAFLLAQSMAVPTPSIKSPTRISSINVRSMISPSGPAPLADDTIQSNSNHYSSLGLSDDDMEMSMMGVPSQPRARSMSITSNSNSLLSPTLSISNGRLAPPRRGSVNAISTGTLSHNLNHRPSLLPLHSISELGLDPHYDTAQSTSEVSDQERLDDEEGDYFDSRSDLGTPNSPFESRFSISNSSLASPSLDARRSRLAQSSLDSLPSMMRADNSSRFSINTNDRRTSKYQVYQLQQLEKSRRANARVAAKMSGATPKELKELVKAQRSPHLDIDIEEKPELPSSKVAAALFFLGFLGPWFWIFGGWMPMSRQTIVSDEEKEMGETGSVVLDFSGAERSWRGWKWTYHPDPWVRRNRRVAAIVIPLLVLGGIGAAIALALVL